MSESELTPSQIVAELDRHIVGQTKAKRAVAIALRNRYRRRQLPEDIRDEVIPKNILMIGPTGVGKTEIARRLAKLAKAPFLKVEATKFTEVGYVGRDVDSMVRDLTDVAIRQREEEMMADVAEPARERAVKRVAAIMEPDPNEKKDGGTPPQWRWLQDMAAQFGKQPNAGEAAPQTPPTPPPAEQGYQKIVAEKREALAERIASGELDGELIEIELLESANPTVNLFGGQGEETLNMGNMLGAMMPKQAKTHRTTVGEAVKLLTREEAGKLVDHDQVVREAIARAESDGIVFIDEMDKIAGNNGGGHGPDVSREGVQRDILPIIEGTTVMTKHGAVNTRHMLFIAAGAFHVSKPSDLIPELQGRLPIRVELEALSQADLKRILSEPQHSLTRQYEMLMGTEGVTLEFMDEALDEIAKIAAQVNEHAENIGARRLHTVMENLLEELSFAAPDIGETRVIVTREYVRRRLEQTAGDEDLSRYIL